MAQIKWHQQLLPTQLLHLLFIAIKNNRSDHDFLRRGRRPSTNRPRTTMFPDEDCEGDLTIPTTIAAPTRAVSFEPRDLGLSLFFLLPLKRKIAKIQMVPPPSLSILWKEVFLLQ